MAEYNSPEAKAHRAYQLTEKDQGKPWRAYGDDDKDRLSCEEGKEYIINKNKEWVEKNGANPDDYVDELNEGKLIEELIPDDPNTLQQDKYHYFNILETHYDNLPEGYQNKNKTTVSTRGECAQLALQDDYAELLDDDAKKAWKEFYPGCELSRTSVGSILLWHVFVNYEVPSQITGSLMGEYLALSIEDKKRDTVQLMLDEQFSEILAKDSEIEDARDELVMFAKEMAGGDLLAALEELV
ncbi:hypothetical protein IWW36_001464 [Coemansia brasiliensis]|uniref:Uncharacterized protein n=1 Tax=Coemansia brasiliensis TaxID=2650707 RepID=A0A9W8I8Z9_9FUNG|nr:hypothetical protein IWW36_001464 [Coemansia brasiliensis]